MEIYKLAANGGEGLEGLTEEEIDELVEYMISNYENIDELVQPNDEL